MTDRAAVAWAVCFVAIGALALVVELELWQPSAGWMWPVLLMVLGLALLLAGAVGSASDRRSQPR